MVYKAVARTSRYVEYYAVNMFCRSVNWVLKTVTGTNKYVVQSVYGAVIRSNNSVLMVYRALLGPISLFEGYVRLSRIR